MIRIQLLTRLEMAPASRLALFTALLLAVAALVGCTSSRKEKSTPPKNPIIAEHMKAIELAGEAMGRAIDDGDAPSVDSTARAMLDQFHQTRAIPVLRENGEPINLRIYTAELDRSITSLVDLRRAINSNRWDIINSCYNDLHLGCNSCHTTYVDRRVVVKLPSPRNF